MEETVFDLPNADIKLIENFFSDKALFDNLKESIAWEEKEIVLFGKKIMQPRLVAFYGDESVSYKYSGQIMQATLWNEVLLDIKQLIANKLKLEFNSCLLNYYRDGNDSMGWHQDNEKELGHNPIIVSASFGGHRLFKLKYIQGKNIAQDIILSNGSTLLMAGETQHYYKHCIPKTKRAVDERINLTFRTIFKNL